MSSLSLLCASRVKQSVRVLELFLGCLERARLDGFVFVDDCDDAEASALLRDFASRHPTQLLPAPPRAGGYARDPITHRWDAPACARAAAMYNQLIDAALADANVGALMLVDADVLMPAELPRHLLGLERDVVSEVYWTRWEPGQPYLPQVWDLHPYGFTHVDHVLRLRGPGQFEVGGLGACTLVHRRVFEAGVRFDPIAGVPWALEDRWFCVRAAVAGFRLWADTTWPPFHVYRDAQLDEAARWVAEGCPPELFRQGWLDGEWERVVRAGLRGR